MGDGSQALRSARFSKAAMEYNRALSVHPGSVEALEGLSKAYLGLGDKDRALELKKKAQSIEHR
jgi:tetratricopeptide (TPR) repeat protein